MTREEFREQVCGMSDLMEFCNENYRLDYIVEDYVSECDFDEIFDEYIIEDIKHNGWSSVSDAIENATNAKDRSENGYYYIYDMSDVSPMSDDDVCDLIDKAEEKYDSCYGFDEENCEALEAITPIKDEEKVDRSVLFDFVG